MPDPILQKAYDEAAVVFSRSFRFVEWKFVIAAMGTSTPFGDRDEPQHKATKKIDRRKWIYVFRNNDEADPRAELLEEILIDKNGDMAATCYDRLRRELDKRGSPVPMGRTMCLPRRMFGQPLVYRFFASRVRLPLKQMKELEDKVTTFAPPVIFDPGKNLSVIEQDGELLVPVVDPVTVALHLHAAFTAAADDIINYTVAHQENENRKIVERRRKKHLLATLLKSIIGEEKNTGANNLVHKLKDQQTHLEDFLAHYEAQVMQRVARRDGLGTFLVRWLGSNALKIASAAYKGAPKASWVQFLVPWCHSIARLNESPPGRQYLDALLDDKTHFIHTYVWPEKKPSNDAIQAVRKGGMTVLEAWKTLAERKILVRGGAAKEIIESLEILLLPTGTLTLKPIDQVAMYHRLRKTTRAIKPVQLIVPDVSKTVHYSADKLKAIGALIESVNLILAVKSTMEAMKGNNPRERELAIIGLVGSSLDAASAIGSLLKKSGNVLATLGFVSGVIDIYLGHVGMSEAFKDGDQDAANGQFLIASGSAVGAAGVLMPLMALPGGQIVTAIGLLVVAIGNIYKMLTSKSPIEFFFARCTWGNEHGRVAGHPDWSPTDFKDWQGEKEFDYQLEALLNILCKIEISHGDSYRDLKYRIGWIPPDSKLVVKYEEEWKDKADNRMFEGEIVFTDKGPTSKTQSMTVNLNGRNGIEIAIAPGLFSQKKTFRRQLNIPMPNPELKKSIAWGRLIVIFDGKTAFTIPHTGWEKKTFAG